MLACAVDVVLLGSTLLTMYMVGWSTQLGLMAMWARCMLACLDIVKRCQCMVICKTASVADFQQ